MARLKDLVLRGARAAGLYGLARRLTRPGVRILCYHGTWRVQGGASGAFRGDAMFMHPDTFSARLETLRRLGYPVISLDQAVAGLRGGTKLPPNAVVITIDDGWYGTYADMLPALEHARMQATLYCDTEQLQAGGVVPHVMARWLAQLTAPHAPDGEAAAAYAVATDRRKYLQTRRDAVTQYCRLRVIDTTAFEATNNFAYMTPAELRDAAVRGLDVQLHTHRHDLYDHTAQEVGREITDNRAALAHMLGQPEARRHFCYPSGVVSPAAVATLPHLGVVSATTTVQGIAWPGMNPFLLPRLMDGEQISAIGFEAELSGFADWLRALRRIASATRAVLGRRATHVNAPPATA